MHFLGKILCCGLLSLAPALAYAFDLQIDQTPSSHLTTAAHPVNIDITTRYLAQGGNATFTAEIEVLVRIDGTLSYTSDDISCTLNNAGQFLQTYRCSVNYQDNVEQQLRVTATPTSYISGNERGYVISRFTGSHAGETNTDNNEKRELIFQLNSIVSTPSQSIASTAISQIRALNLNSDNRPDLAVGYVASQAPAIFYNQGSNGFSNSPLALPGSGLANINEILADDIDDDGNQDIIVTYPSTTGQPVVPGGLRHYQADANYVYSVGSKVAAGQQDIRSAALVDVNNDDNNDLIIGNNGPNRIILNSGSVIKQSVGPATTIDGNNVTTQIHSALINSDDYPELLFNINSNTIWYADPGEPLNSLYPDSLDQALPENTNARLAQFLNLDDDTDTDLVTMHCATATLNLGNCALYFNYNSSGAISFSNSYNWIPDSISSMGVADFDNDNDQDIYLHFTNGEIVVLVNGPGQTLQFLSTGFRGLASALIDVADLTGDGFPDLAMASSTGDGIRIYSNPLGNSNNVGVSVLSGSGSGSFNTFFLMLLLLTGLGRKLVLGRLNLR